MTRAETAIDQLVAEAVDNDFYHFSYKDLPADTLAAAHYVTVGWREGRDPNPWFSTASYLQQHPELRSGEISPLTHYLLHGGAGAAAPSRLAAAFYSRPPAAGRKPKKRPASPSRRVPDQLPADSEFTDAWLICFPEFDHDFYRVVNPDVQGMDPLAHFVQQGWRENRNPNAWFDVRQYYEANPDVAAAGINPFVHYLIAGRQEKRALSLNLGYRAEILANPTTPEQRIASLPNPSTSDTVPPSQVRRALDNLERSGGRAIHLSVSHDDYTATIGGLQLCLHRESAAFARLGFDHIHLFPARPMLFTDRENADPVLGILLNGIFCGALRVSELARALAPVFRNNASQKTLAIHSLLGHNVRALVTLLKMLDVTDGFFWVHDFAAVCAGHNLLRNDVQFCGAPPPDSAACGICIYGKRRSVQVADHEHLFSELDLFVAAPAEVTLDTWMRASSFTAVDYVVHPHCTFDRTRKVNPPGGGIDRPLRVAYLGFPHVHKGWPVFRQLALRYVDDARYEFYHLGQFEQVGLPMQFVDVEVQPDDPAAMLHAVNAHEIDVAVIWSLCAETFSFVGHEAIAGGAHVFAPKGSGNLERLVDATGKGLTITSEADLFQVFDQSLAMRHGRSVRSVELSELRFGNLTADFVEVPV